MVNLLLLLGTRRQRRVSGDGLRRYSVAVPVSAPTTDAFFVVMRRLRYPLMTLILVFAVAVLGLTLIPGRDADGNVYRLTMFEAFYFMSYTATTIGFGEIPYSFTTAQRMWVTASIYSSVLGWAYSIGVVFSLLQEEGFREAIATQRFRSKLRRMKDPFLIVAGYGQAGRTVAQSLDGLGRQCVIVDAEPSRIDRLQADQLITDPPGIAGDARNPAVLGLAGLSHPCCQGVLALTDNDDVNLSIVMAVHLLRPEVQVIARCDDRAAATRMEEFSPEAVINPYDRFGGYLVLALQRPRMYQLVSWLMSPIGTPLPRFRKELGQGRWIVCADGEFGQEVTRDLRMAGIEVELVPPEEGLPDVGDVVGFLAGTEQDTTNLSLAAHARLYHEDVFVCLRQKSHINLPLLQAFAPDAVFVPTELVAEETLARVVTPAYWSFLEHILVQDDEFSAMVVKKLVERFGRLTPEPETVTLDFDDSPAAARWMRRGGTLVLEDLLRRHTDRDAWARAYPVMLLRGDHEQFWPPLDTVLEIGDQILLLGQPEGFDDVSELQFSDSALAYVVTGENIHSTWIWRAVQRRRRRRARASAAR